MNSLASSITTQRGAVRKNVQLGVQAIVATPGLSELGEREIEFLIKARQVAQKRADSRKKAEKRRQADDEAIALIANAMVEIIEDEPGDVNDLDRERVALAAEVPINVVKRVWKDAVWYARDVDGRLSVGGASMMTAAERESALVAMTHSERERRLAYHALCSPETVQTRLENKEKAYSHRQKNIVRKDLQREEYQRLTADEPCPQRLLQSGWDRVNIGYSWATTARVGGATQADGQGKYLQNPFIEKGFRSNTAKGASLKRLVASTPKIGARRRGRVTGMANIKRALYLDQIGKSYVEIAADIGQSVQRVRATIWDNVNQSVLRTGLTNDRRFVHQTKWAALDQIHGNLRVDCVDMFRPVELDRDFEDVHELIEFIAKRKAKPFKVIWVRDDARPGVIPRPHFLFALPEGWGIWYGEAKAMAMLEAVAVAICEDYGGDVGGLANMFDTKLPTSPHNEYISYETENLLTLGELCELYEVDLRVDLTRGARRLATEGLAKTGVEKTVSNELWTLIRKRAWEISRRWEDDGDLRVDAHLDRAIFADQLIDACMEDAFILAELNKLSGAKRAGAEKMLQSAVRGVAEKYGRDRRIVRGRGYDIGAAEDEVALAKEKARRQAEIEFAGDTEFEVKVAKAVQHAGQSAGQDYGRRQRNARTVRQIADQIAIDVAAGREPTAKGVAKAIGRDPRTVEKHWDAAVVQAAANYSVRAVMKASMHNAKKSDDPVAGTIAPTSANNSSVRGVPTTYSEDDVVRTAKKTSDQRAPIVHRLEDVLPVQLNRLVKRVKPWNPANGKPPTCWNFHMFTRLGMVQYTSGLGFRRKIPRIGREPVVDRSSGETIDPQRSLGIVASQRDWLGTRKNRYR